MCGRVPSVFFYDMYDQTHLGVCFQEFYLIKNLFWSSKVEPPGPEYCTSHGNPGLAASRN